MIYLDRQISTSRHLAFSEVYLGLSEWDLALACFVAMMLSFSFETYPVVVLLGSISWIIGSMIIRKMLRRGMVMDFFLEVLIDAKNWFISFQ